MGLVVVLGAVVAHDGGGGVGLWGIQVSMCHAARSGSRGLVLSSSRPTII